MKNELLKITTNKLEIIKEAKKVNENFIVSKQLTWLPWLGEEYKNQKQKLLIIGESHYFDPNEDDCFEKDGSFDKHTNINFTQKVVKEIAINRNLKDKRSAKMYELFYRSICKENQTRNDFWNTVAFYNFIQQPMNSLKERPSSLMVEKGWSSFNQVVSILKPDVIIFIGVKCCEGFNQFALNKVKNLKYGNKVTDRQIPRIASVSIDSKEIPLHFIKHSSSFYSIDSWRKYFEKNNII